MTRGAGYAPWVGAGSPDAPYTVQVLQLSWQARAEVILAGYTCMNPETGTVYESGEYDSRWRANSSVERLINVGSGPLGEIEIPEEMVPGVSAYQFTPVVVGGTIADLVAWMRNRRLEIIAQLGAAYPDLDWELDPVGAAITLLDDLRLGDDEAQRLWEYYRYVFTPTLPTPDGPDDCYMWITVDGQEVVCANIDRCRELVALPDDVANQVRRAELCYWLIVFTECDIATALEGI